MSVKKFLVLTTAGAVALAAGAAQAGGPDVMAPPAPIDYSGIYFEGNLGWSLSNWTNFWAGAINPSPLALFSPAWITSNGRTGFTWGFDLGYQFNKYFSAELGWYKLPTVSGFFPAPVPGAPGFSQRSWFVYLAGKVAVPVADNFDLFGKAGVAWRHLSLSGAVTGLPAFNLIPSSGSYWAPYFAFGMQYWINDAWIVNLQYQHVASNVGVTNIATAAPSANLVTMGVGYKFAV